MPRYSANISLLFAELPFLDRFAAARQAGFEAVECWFLYDYPVEIIRDRLDEHNLRLVGINTNAGLAANGDWGLACLPGRTNEFRRSVDQAIRYAQALSVPAIHVMAGNRPSDCSIQLASSTYVENLAWALQQSASTGLTLMLEPLNSHDRPEYFLRTCDQASQIIGELGNDRLGIMFDIYHVQRTEGDILKRLNQHWGNIRHIQIASVPGRHEPGSGELNDGLILAEIDRMGWSGWVGAEYLPAGSTEDGLAWRSALGR